jgi:hypothetical protein
LACGPMGIPATFMLAPGCSPWRLESEPTTSRDAFTDGAGGADMQHESNRLMVGNLQAKVATGCHAESG